MSWIWNDCTCSRTLPHFMSHKQDCNLWRNQVKLLSFSEQLIQPYLEGMRRTGMGYWRCGISYGWNLTTCGSRYRNLAPPFASVRDAAGTLPGPRRAANRMEVTWINYVTSHNPAQQCPKNVIVFGCQSGKFRPEKESESGKCRAKTGLCFWLMWKSAVICALQRW